MVTTIEDYTQRSRRTNQVDGLLDIAAGIVFFALALISFAGVQSVASMHGSDFQTSPSYQNANNFFIAAIFAANALILLCSRGMEPMKRRFVYPRLGYAQHRVNPRERQRATLFLYLLSVVTVLLLLRMFGVALPVIWTSDMTLVCIGIGFGASLVLNYRKFGFVRHLVVAGISVIASLLVVSTHPDWLHGSLYLALILGTSLMISGAVPFMRVLRLPVLSGADAS